MLMWALGLYVHKTSMKNKDDKKWKRSALELTKVQFAIQHKPKDGPCLGNGWQRPKDVSFHPF